MLLDVAKKIVVSQNCKIAAYFQIAFASLNRKYQHLYITWKNNLNKLMWSYTQKRTWELLLNGYLCIFCAFVQFIFGVLRYYVAKRAGEKSQWTDLLVSLIPNELCIFMHHYGQLLCTLILVYIWRGGKCIYLSKNHFVYSINKYCNQEKSNILFKVNRNGQLHQPPPNKNCTICFILLSNFNFLGRKICIK